jgi:hypothetical protein
MTFLALRSPARGRLVSILHGVVLVIAAVAVLALVLLVAIGALFLAIVAAQAMGVLS